jgi:glycosyltransferase involved in cell wall biosynthesis
VSQFSIYPSVEEYWFTVARLEPYKRLDLILGAFAQLGWPIKVAGTGSRHRELASWARYPNIQILGRIEDHQLAELYGRARAVVFAANEDAGIVPLEAMAAGRPVLAYGAGGALESVVAGVTGEFFPHQTVASLVGALTHFRPERYDPAIIRRHAEQFDVAVFATKVQAVILSLLGRR